MKRLFGVIAICTAMLGLALYLINIVISETDGVAVHRREAWRTPDDENSTGIAAVTPKDEPERRAAPVPPGLSGNAEPMPEAGVFDAGPAPATPAELAKWKKQMLNECKSLVRAKTFDKARYCYWLLLAQDPDDANAHLGLGIMAAMTGDRDDAYYRYQKFIELAPDDMRAPQVRMILDEFDANISNGSMPPEVDPKMGGASEGLPESLSPEQIAGAMKKIYGALKGCADQQRQRDPGVTGTLEISFVIQSWGRATDVKIVTQEHKGQYVAGCISYLIKNVHFPRFTGDPIPVERMPFKLGK
ncbi:MAG TPA: AgmX/PglI C-terminal domain-containing protein [Myxococcota bacterium]|nr:AgmX/PglI C-terminal domain-containing protein [Myxococcota bacterium]